MPTIIFDVDGVLVDSLQSHWQFTLDQAKKHNITLKVNGIALDINTDPRLIVASPMGEFLRRAGFPDTLINTVITAYEETFADKYETKPFPEILGLLKSLQKQGVTLGIVSSNTRRNVVKNLGYLMTYFRFMSTLGDYPNKTVALNAAKHNPLPITFIGDMESDWIAAQAAQVNFIGCTYGWGFNSQETRFPIVNTIAELQETLLEQT